MTEPKFPFDLEAAVTAVQQQLEYIQTRTWPDERVPANHLKAATSEVDARMIFRSEDRYVDLFGVGFKRLEIVDGQYRLWLAVWEDEADKLSGLQRKDIGDALLALWEQVVTAKPTTAGHSTHITYTFPVLTLREYPTEEKG